MTLSTKVHSGRLANGVQLVKLYGEAPEAETRYSPAECIGASKDKITGNPDRMYVSTSHVERSTLSFRNVACDGSWLGKDPVDDGRYR